MKGKKEGISWPTRGSAQGRTALSHSDAFFLMVAKNLCGFRTLAALGGFYGNARHDQRESNEADRHHVGGHATTGVPQRPS